MGRELKRKQEKKVGKKIKRELYEGNSSDNEIYNFVKIILIVLIIFSVLYIVVGVFVTKEIDLFNKNDNNVTENNVNNKILAVSTFSQKEEEYYVYFYDFANSNSSVESIFTSKLSDYKIYRVNVKDDFNKNYVTEESGNRNAKNLEQLKVKEDTLIKIVNDQIEEYYESVDEIMNIK